MTVASTSPPPRRGAELAQAVAYNRPPRIQLFGARAGCGSVVDTRGFDARASAAAGAGATGDETFRVAGAGAGATTNQASAPVIAAIAAPMAAARPTRRPRTGARRMPRTGAAGAPPPRNCTGEYGDGRVTGEILPNPCVLPASRSIAAALAIRALARV
jgi:hypothetical protein